MAAAVSIVMLCELPLLVEVESAELSPGLACHVASIFVSACDGASVLHWEPVRPAMFIDVECDHSVCLV